MRSLGAVWLLVAALSAGGALAQDRPSVQPAAQCCVVPAGTPVMIELGSLVSSRFSKPDAMFTIRLAEDLIIDGQVVAPAGSEGEGQVVDSAPGSVGGRPGKLILAARYIQVGETRVPLRSFRVAGVGKDESHTVEGMSAAPYIGILALGLHGGNIDYPPGVRAQAKVATDTLLPSSGLPAKPGADDQKETP